MSTCSSCPAPGKRQVKEGGCSNRASPTSIVAPAHGAESLARGCPGEPPSGEATQSVVPPSALIHDQPSSGSHQGPSSCSDQCTESNGANPHLGRRMDSWPSESDRADHRSAFHLDGPRRGAGREYHLGHSPKAMTLPGGKTSSMPSANQGSQSPGSGSASVVPCRPLMSRGMSPQFTTSTNSSPLSLPRHKASSMRKQGGANGGSGGHWMSTSNGAEDHGA